MTNKNKMDKTNVNAQANGATTTVENGIEVNDLVVVNNNQAVTTSLKVAEVFGKQHKNVIQSIQNLFTTAENSAFVDNQEVMSYFAEIELEQPMPVGGGVKKVPAYIMTREGFDLLVMGFTGEKALAYKVAYIKAFRAMSEKLRETEMQKVMGSGSYQLIAPFVKEGPNPLVQTIENLKAFKYDFVKRIYKLEREGLRDDLRDKLCDDFNQTFMSIRGLAVDLINQETIFSADGFSYCENDLRSLRESRSKTFRTQIAEIMYTEENN